MFSTDTELGILRIVQETISNIRRHSMAANVQILLEFKDDSLSITIVDDGKGFIVPANISDLARDGKLGLMNMRQRAKFLNGDLNISSVPGEGTRVSLTVAKNRAKNIR
jgi:signal transduction histidine kinase